jgi:hypothetical protein
MEGINSMVKYKVNLKFKEDGKSLNEIITEILKIELNKIVNNNLSNEIISSCIHYSQNEGNSN